MIDFQQNRTDNIRILIIDDDESICSSLEMVLDKMGYETDVATTGRAAREKAQERSFNLVLVDIKLPDMQGTELISPLKEMHPDIVVIMITAYATLETAMRAVNEGATAYITKPFNVDEVLARVHEALEKQHLVRENRRLYQEVQQELVERKRVEAERKRIEAQLLHSQKMEAIGRLAGGLAHDLNNVITSIMSCSSFLLEGLSQDDPLRADAEEVKKAGQRAAGLIRQILTFARRQVLKPTVLDLNPAVVDMEEMLGRLIGESMELGTVLDPQLGLVSADLGQIEQVIMNLAVNARDAMPQGGSITVKTENAVLDESCACTQGLVEPGSYVMLAVSDTGIGMGAETLSRIFEPFFTTKQQDVGTGLGLSTVHGIVKQSGGHISVYSEPGLGTTFKIYLPRINEGVEQIRLDRVQKSTLEGSETLLLVGNDCAVRDSALKVLREYGYLVTKARDGNEALRICRQHEGPIDLMVTDFVMPGISGEELVGRLRHLRPQMKRLYISGCTENVIVGHGDPVPNAYFLNKPFSPETLVAKVREVLDAL